MGFLSDPSTLNDVNYTELYREFISRLMSHLKPLRFAQIATKCASSIVDLGERRGFYDSVLLERSKLGEEASLYLDIQLALVDLELEEDDGHGIRDRMREMEGKVEGMICEDSTVAASFYQLSFEYFRRFGPAHLFYKNALLFLSHTSFSHVLSPDDIFHLAVDLSVAALSSMSIFNFGEVVRVFIFIFFHFHCFFCLL